MTAERSPRTEEIGNPKSQAACVDMGRGLIELHELPGRVATRLGEAVARHIPHRRINAPR